MIKPAQLIEWYYFKLVTSPSTDYITSCTNYLALYLDVWLGSLLCVRHQCFICRGDEPPMWFLYDCSDPPAVLVFQAFRSFITLCCGTKQLCVQGSSSVLEPACFLLHLGAFLFLSPIFETHLCGNNTLPHNTKHLTAICVFFALVSDRMRGVFGPVHTPMFLQSSSNDIWTNHLLL